MKIINYLITAIEEGKITKEKALEQLEKFKDNLIDYKRALKELKERFKFISD